MPPEDPLYRRRLSHLPSFLLSLCFLALSVLAWPDVLERGISLDWGLGDARPVAYGVQALCLLLFSVTLLARKRVDILIAKMTTTWKDFFFAVLTILVALGLCLAATEVAFRLFHFPFLEMKVPSENALALYDEEVGWSYRPRHSAIQTFGSRKRTVPMFFSDIGSRVAGPGIQHDSDAPTVIFVGGSYTFGHGLSFEDSFVGVLDGMTEFPYQVVNMGVQGYGTDQSFLLLKRVFHQFNSRVVVYTCMDRHPFRNANYDRRVMHPKSRFLGTKCLFALNKDGTIFLKKTPERTDDLHYSRLWACFQIAWTRFGPKPSDDLTRALIREMREYVESNGATFITMYWDQTPFEGLEVNAIDTLVDAPRGWTSRDCDYWRITGDGHYNARAQKRIARLVMAKFRKLDLIR